MIKNNISFANSCVNVETVTGTGEILEDKSGSGRARPWNMRKDENIKLQELYEIARDIDPLLMSDNRFQALQDCGGWLLFNEYSDRSRKLAKANFCRVRTCPVCNWRKSLKMFSQVSVITDYINTVRVGKVRYLFLTLTIKNVTGEELSKAIDNMNSGFRKLVGKNKKYKEAVVLKESLLGYMKAMEITYNSRSDTFHPHFHIVLEVTSDYFGRNYIKQLKWREIWQSLMKLDYLPQVDVQAIDVTKAKAVAEVAKYPIKTDSILHVPNKFAAAEALRCLHRATFKRRLITFGGEMAEAKRMLSLDDIEDGDLIHVEADEEKGLNVVAEYLFTYNARLGLYIC